MELRIELYKENGLYKAYISDDCGGSGIKTEGDTPDTLGDMVGAYVAGYATRCVKAELMKDGRTKICLSNYDVVFLKNCYDIVGVGGEHHSIEIYDETGKHCGTIENVTIPDPEEIDDEFIEMVEDAIEH